MSSISISNMKFVYLRRFTLFSSWAYSVFLFYKKKVVPGLLQFLVLFCMQNFIQAGVPPSANRPDISQ